MGDLRIQTIFRKEKITIKIDGKEITAYKGETVLAALVAAGYRTLKKSNVYHEPRGALCGMGVCYECQVSINKKSKVRACMTEVEENMDIRTDA